VLQQVFCQWICVSYYWYYTTDREIRVDSHYGLVKINSKARLHNVNDVFVFAKQCQQVYYTYTPFFRKDWSRVDWLSILKTKPRGCVEVEKDENEDISVGDDGGCTYFTLPTDCENYGGLIKNFSAKWKIQSEFTDGITNGFIKNNII
jgi:hypothetical protein